MIPFFGEKDFSLMELFGLKFNNDIFVEELFQLKEKLFDLFL